MRITLRPLVLSAIAVGLIGPLSCTSQSGTDCAGRAKRMMEFVNWAMTVEWYPSMIPESPWTPVGITKWIEFEDTKATSQPPLPGPIFRSALAAPPSCADIQVLVSRFSEWWEDPVAGGHRWVEAHESVHPVTTPLDSLPSPLTQQKLSQWFMGTGPHNGQGFWQWVLNHAAENPPAPGNDPPPPPDPFGEN